jgi:transcriptional regulator with XRE-family HTH domain
MRECPICGSVQLVPVRHGAGRTEGSLALDGTDVDEWVCGDCGHRCQGQPQAEAELIPFPVRRPEIEPDPTPAEPSTELGGTLRRAREDLGLGIEQAAEATGIWPAHLRALEEDEPVEAFPGAAYARLYLRDYAAFLGLDPEPLLRAQTARFGEEDEGPALEALPDPRASIRRAWRGLTVVSVAVLLTLMIAPQIRVGGTPEPSPAQAPRADRFPRTATVPVAREPRGAPPRPGVDHIRVLLEMRGPCWIGATVDGERRVWRTAVPGERIVLRGDRAVELVLGNGGGVILRVNGERVPTGGHGEVVRLTFRLDDGVVRTERA